VKTRLAAALGRETAALLARAFLLDTLARLRPFPGDVWLAHDPPDATRRFQELVDDAGETAFLLPQGDGDLGERLEAVLLRLRERGYDRVLLLGADSPTLPWHCLIALHEALGAHPFALGPTADGGFWGLGARQWQHGLLADLPWSTPDTLTATRARLETVGAVALAPAWYDLDELDDLRRLRADPALAYCPHTNRLVQSERVARYL
jgi:rSAM/selenodomain-associated transferase 1